MCGCWCSPKNEPFFRATSATEMLQAGVPEKVIQKRSGHRSTETLRLYERISDEQHKAATAVPSSTDKADYNSLLPVTEPETKPVPLQTAPGQPNTPTTAAPGKDFNFHGCTVSMNFTVQPRQELSLGDIDTALWDELLKWLETGNC